jgi:hypothetical protein
MGNHIESDSSRGDSNRALSADGFWSKVLVPNGQWEIILKRIRKDNIPATAIGVDGFWSLILVPDHEWEIILKRIRGDRVPDVAMTRGGLWTRLLVPKNEWQKIRTLLRDQRLQTCFSSSAFWTNCTTKDWTAFFKHAQNQKKITERYLEKYAKERPLFYC